MNYELLSQLDGARNHGGELAPYVVNGLLDDSFREIEKLHEQLTEAIAALEWAGNRAEDIDTDLVTGFTYETMSVVVYGETMLALYRAVHSERVKEPE